ncbi:MAG: hypothetical protein NC131_13995 [Roseburia sp.]|nr:hypothetical protein [Roseburia sp.]
MKKAPIWDALLDNKSDSNEFGDSINAGDSIKELEKKDKIIETDSLPQSIFIFGDSMTYNLALRLAQYAAANGHQIHSVNWDSSNTKIWAEHDTLKNYIEKFRPTQIFISLGSNELYYKNPSSREQYIKKILEVIDTIPYVWIGPPNWKEDTGMNDLLEKSCKPKSFFRSEGMTFERKADKVHPTRKSSALWVDSVMRWLPKSSHPIVMNIPPDSIKKSNPNIVFLKALNK